MTPSIPDGREIVSGWLDPLEFCRDLIEPEPRDFQPRFFRAVREYRRVLLKCIRGGGKTFALAVLVFWSLAMGWRVVVIAPIRSQLDHLLRELESIWRSSPRLRAMFPEWKIYGDRIDTADPKICATFSSAETGAPLLEGAHAENVVVICDEAKSVADNVPKSLEPMLIGPESRFIAASTAGFGVGWFDAGFGRRMSSWDAALTVGIEEVPRLAAKKAQMAKLLGESDPIYRAFYENVAGGGVEGEPFFDLNKLHAAVGRELPRDNGMPRVWALDVARYGRDWSVLARRSGGVVHPLLSWRKCDLMETVGRVLQVLRNPAITEKPESIIVDASGLGGGVADRLRERIEEIRADSIEVIDFIAGSKPERDAEFWANDKTLSAATLAGMLERGEVQLPPGDPGLIAELASYTRTIASTSKARICDPSNRSPDRADAALMLFCNDAGALGSSGGPWPLSVLDPGVRNLF